MTGRPQPDPAADPLGPADDVLSRLRLRARLTAAEAAERPGASHARPRWRLAPSRWAAIGVAAALTLAVLGLVAPSVIAAGGGGEDDPAAETAPVAWDNAPTAEPSAGGEGAGSGDGSGGGLGGGLGEGADKLLVHVAGAVASPGVVELVAGARVFEALAAAGGATADADLSVLNLAARVADGERIFVPRPGETPPPVIGSTGGAGSSAGSGDGDAGAGAAGATVDGKVDVNHANAEALTALPGIGPVLAQRIVDFRTANGPFGQLSDLAEVTGIGPKILAGLAEAVAFG
ncbi:MAG: helix-hairpin-helix domain-containing protein [Bifidobacteriaceae bacterium]|jgi:competence protein ComEA|nr:helix-hairpin-helix domain-containing protein [Bifidobacteriaceae bacterium]